MAKRLSRIGATLTSEPLGWHAALFRQWVGANALAFTIILATVYLLAGTSLDVTEQAAGDTAATLLLAVAGAILYGVTLGLLQQRVLHKRIAVSRRRWVLTCVGPGLIIWSCVVLPPVIDTATSGGNVQAAYLLAVSQGLGLGPVLGLAQAFALRPHTRRWAWWIAANAVSWLIVDLGAYLLSLIFDPLNLAREGGSTLEVYVMLLATTPLTGRGMLWVTAPSALTPAAAGRSSAAPGRRRSVGGHPRSRT